MSLSSRVRRVVNAVLIAALVFAVAVPAVGDHVSEPTAPVVDVWLRLLKYPDRSTVLACDGSDVVDFTNLRIETYIKVEDTPSEHWDSRLIVEGAFINQHGREQWVTQWASDTKHSNIAPHSKRVQQWGMATQKLTEFTKWRVYVRVTTWESGQVFERECVFTVAD